MARWLNWLEHSVHTRRVEGSSPPLATKTKRVGVTYSFCFTDKLNSNMPNPPGGLRAHEVQWTAFRSANFSWRGVESPSRYKK